MYNYQKTGLRIFDNFQIDFNLPKWRIRINKAHKNGDAYKLPVPTLSRNSNVESGFNIITLPSSINIIAGGSSGTVSTNKSSDKSSFLKIFEGIFQRNKLRRTKELFLEASLESNFATDGVLPPEAIAESENSTNEKVVSVEEFFKSVKNSVEELELVAEHSKNYDKIISHLKATGQEALYEQMSMDIEGYRAEAQLYATGHRKVITEKNIIDFIDATPKKIRLDWIRNFTRSIPSTIVELKIKLDELHIFDNYVIMHYDPDNKGNAMTAEEKQKASDPILFGLIAGKQNLYYIGDWIDEYCDLTFDKLVAQLGVEAISANDITSNVSIPSEQINISK